MSQDWTEKYRPKSLKDVIGNPKAVGELKAWADSWDKGIPEKRAVVLMGTPGVGKTTSAEALAADKGWGLLEMNASDQRTGDAIRSIALRGSYSNTFDDTGNYLDSKSGGRKLIVLDEADSLFGNADRGALPAIAELIRTTKQPVILIVNDFYALSKKSAVVKTDTVQINFMHPQVPTMIKALRNIASGEGVAADDEALRAIAERSNGDMRAAVRDLQATALGRKQLDVAGADEVSDRIIRKSMYDLMTSIFRKGDFNGSRRMMQDIDEEPSFKLLWIDENMPYEFRDPGDLVRGYEKLSRADVYLGRVSRRQYYGMWSYASDMMSSGVCTARRTSFVNRERFRFPMYMAKLSRSRSVRATKGSLCQKLADYTHASTDRISHDVLPCLKIMLKNDAELRRSLVVGANLEPEELAFILDAKIDSKAVKDAYADDAAVKVQPPKAVPVITEEDKAPVQEKPVPARTQKSLFEF